MADLVDRGADPTGTGALAMRLAREVRAPRLVFRQAYDTFLAEVARPELPRSFLHALALSRSAGATLDPARDADAYAMALGGLGDAVGLAASMLAGQGIFDPPDAPIADRRAAQARVGALYAPPDSPAQRGEVAVDPMATDVDPARQPPAFLLACRRVCRIRTVNAAGAPVTGTGFLIGPSVVLTNWHVVRDLLALAELKPSLLTFYFDSLVSGQAVGVPYLPRAKDWLLETSAMGPERPPEVTDASGWWDDSLQRERFLSALGDHLDFAVIALEAAPGDQRGWYNLAETGEASGTCQVFHHPGGRPMSVSAGSVRYASLLHNTRIFHSATTAGGSSGGLMLDARGVPIGLHSAGYDTEKGGIAGSSKINCAVPLEAIAEKLGKANLESFARTRRLVAPLGCIGGGRPMFGREDLLGDLQELAAGDKRILWIRSPEATFRRPGKSFSVEVMKALLPANIYVELSADMVQAEPRAMAALILDTIAPGRSALLPHPEDSATAHAAYVRDHLVSKLFQLITDGTAGRQVWFILDDLDTIFLPDTGGRLFLDELYRRVEECGSLRVVLIGLNTALTNMPPSALRVHDIDTGVDIGALFGRWLELHGERDKPIAPEVKTLLGAIMRSCAGGEAPMERLAEFHRLHLAKALGEFFTPAGRP